jgi:release factor glutamine methyltransferase
MTLPIHSAQELITSLTPKYGPQEAAAIVRILVEDAFNTGAWRSFVPQHTDEARWTVCVARLLDGEPVQYVVGKSLFLGRYFEVSPAVLIPRQETEELVEWALACIQKSDHTSPKCVLDIGLGSGCIGISIAAERPDVQLHGIEKSEAALDVAQANAAALLPTKTIDFRLGDALELSSMPDLPLMHLVVSNPPYIPWQEKALMPAHVLEYEPPMALFVPNHDPLLFYRNIAQWAKQQLLPNGWLLFECNEFNAHEVVSLLETLNYTSIELRSDMSGAPRMVGAQKKLELQPA